MTHSFIVRPKAASDMQSAKEWYDDRRPGLGDEFIAEVLRAFDVIARNPLAFRVRHRDTRRLGVHRFPYGVFYKVIRDQIRVVAIYHDKRDPKGWMNRR